MSLAADVPASSDHNPISDVEAQMRRALGLYGGMRARSDSDRGEPSVRGADRFGQPGGNPGLHRRRFVQDGEIPVTVVRRDPATDMASAPQSSRLQRTEAALAAETAARERAERALQDAQAQIAALQTKIGHADLARAEAADVARREREAAAQLRESSESFDEQLQSLRDQIEAAEQSRRQAQGALAEERSARKTAERALRELTDRAEQAERALSALEEEVAAKETWEPPAAPLRPRTAPSAARHVDVTASARRGRPPGPKAALKPAVQAANEAEPVKWWLMPAGKTKAR